MPKQIKLNSESERYFKGEIWSYMKWHFSEFFFSRYAISLASVLERALIFTVSMHIFSWAKRCIWKWSFWIKKMQTTLSYFMNELPAEFRNNKFNWHNHFTRFVFSPLNSFSFNCLDTNCVNSYFSNCISSLKANYIKKAKKKNEPWTWPRTWLIKYLKKLNNISRRPQYIL